MKHTNEYIQIIKISKIGFVTVAALVLLLVALLLPAYASASQTTATTSSTDKTLLAGLKAEQEGHWVKALVIYRIELSHDPGRFDLWYRIGNILTVLNEKEKEIAKLTLAAKANPNDKEIFVQLSQGHAELNRPKEALAAIERAVQLDPDNIDYLKARAQLANWLGTPKIAARSYHRLLKLVPMDDELMLWFARSDTWSGRLDRAAATYKKYLSKKWRPGNLDVMIEYVKVQTWRGNFAAALKLIETYREKGGNELIYKQRKADILCRGDRPRAGMKELATLLDDDPGDYEMNTARTIALFYDHRPVEAMNSLDTLEKLRPQSYENRELRKFVWTPLRHAFPMHTQYYSDSIGIDIFSANLDGGIRLNRRTHLKGGYSRDHLRSPVESEFNNIDGSEDALHFKQWVGADLRLSRSLKVDGYVGTEKAEELGSSVTYGFNTHLQLSDHFNITLGRNHNYFLISPRAVSLGIKMTA
ncbi:MAG: hypothetical protein GY807_20230, partial [Gammaproteobacteria bacterium]|nr:hypothetical protein [Gammaproteobacteria bacterium]